MPSSFFLSLLCKNLKYSYLNYLVCRPPYLRNALIPQIVTLLYFVLLPAVTLELSASTSELAVSTPIPSNFFNESILMEL